MPASFSSIPPGNTKQVFGDDQDRAIERIELKQQDLVFSIKVSIAPLVLLDNVLREVGYQYNRQIYREAANNSRKGALNNQGLSRKHIIRCLDSYLQHSQLAHVDVIYAPRPGRHTPIEESVRAFNHVITGARLRGPRAR